MKNVSNYIGTRNIGQVRSHLQKYLIKQNILKEKSKKLNVEKKVDSKNVEEDDDNKINKEIKLEEEE